MSGTTAEGPTTSTPDDPVPATTAPDDPSAAIRVRGLEKTHRSGLVHPSSTEALRDCDITLPVGSVTALFGANGAGKSTLLRLLAGLGEPDAGTCEVGGRTAFVGQDKPLYRHLHADAMAATAARLNRSWDAERAHGWLDRFEVPRRRACGRLSGGQRTLVALALAVGAAPNVLLLDEPLADLDPLVRREVSAALLDQAAEYGMTVLLSTHVVADVVGVVDHVVVLARGRVLLADEVDDVAGEHARYVGPVSDGPPVDGSVVDAVHHDTWSQFVVRRPAQSPGMPTPEGWTATPLPLEDLVNAYLTGDRKASDA